MSLKELRSRVDELGTTWLAWLIWVLCWAEGGKREGLVGVVLTWLDDRLQFEEAQLWGALIFGVILLASTTGACLWRWLMWAGEPSEPVSLKGRGLCLLGAWLSLWTVGLGIWIVLPALQRPYYEPFIALSRRELGTEVVHLSLLAVAMAIAPSGWIKRFSARPTRALLGGSLLAMLGLCWGLTEGQISHRWVPGWGRLVLLGVALGGGFAIGARGTIARAALADRRASRALPGVAALVLLSLSGPSLAVLTNDLPGHALLFEVPFEWFVYRAIDSPALYAGWVLLTLHLTGAWGSADPSPRGNPLLCALIAFQCLPLLASVIPSELVAFFDRGLLVHAIVPLLGSPWLLLTIALWALRLRSRSLAVEEELPRIQEPPGQVLEEDHSVALGSSQPSSSGCRSRLRERREPEPLRDLITEK